MTTITSMAAAARSMLDCEVATNASNASKTTTTAAVVANGRRLETMFEEHYDAIWRTLRRLGVKHAEVDDAAQRVFLVAARRLDTIVHGHEGRYLYGIAVRVASERRRRDPTRREVNDEVVLALLPDEKPGPEERLLDHEARAALDATLGGMPDDLREVFVLVEIEGLTMAEVSDIFEIPTGTAASRLRRAREAFRESARRVRARLEHVGYHSRGAR